MDTKAHEGRQGEAEVGQGSRFAHSFRTAAPGSATEAKPGEMRARLRSPSQDFDVRCSMFDVRRSAAAPRRCRAAFTLVEVLAALLFMAIVIPVVMQGVSVASRAGILGERKAAAMRIAERMLDEIIVTGETNQANANGTITEGNATYSWTMESQPWSEDAMTEMTVKVTFTVQGNEYDVSATTLYDPTMAGMTPDSE